MGEIYQAAREAARVALGLAEAADAADGLVFNEATAASREAAAAAAAAAADAVAALLGLAPQPTARDRRDLVGLLGQAVAARRLVPDLPPGLLERPGGEAGGEATPAAVAGAWAATAAAWRREWRRDWRQHPA